MIIVNVSYDNSERQVNQLIKLHIDQSNSKNVIELKHDLYSNEQLIEELTYVLDMIVSDCSVKVGEKYKTRSNKENSEIALEKRNEVLYLMLQKSFTCEEYFLDKNNDIYASSEYCSKDCD